MRGDEAELLADPVLDQVRLSAPGEAPARGGADHRVLVMRRPGVMDPVALTVERTVARSLGPAADGSPVRVLTFQAWELSGRAWFGIYDLASSDDRAGGPGGTVTAALRAPASPRRWWI